jgi:hypothetical protein
LLQMRRLDVLRAGRRADSTVSRAAAIADDGVMMLTGQLGHDMVAT